MPVSFTDADEWCAEYKNATPEGKHELMLQTISQPLSGNFLDNLDLVDYLLDHIHKLDMHNRTGDLVSLIEQTRDGQPDLYREDFYYFDQHLVFSYLYLDQVEKLGGPLSRYATDPVSGFDYLRQAFNLLRLYQKADLAVDLSDRIFQTVRDSVEIISGAEDRLAETVYFYRAEQLYRQLQTGQQINWPDFVLPLSKFGFQASKIQEDLTRYLGGEVSGPDGFLDLLRQYGHGGRWFLAYDFCKYMLNQKELGFVTSDLIWEEAIAFWEKREHSLPDKDSLDQFFYFTEQDLDAHLGNMLSSFLSQEQPSAVGLLWGLPYIYDFLLKKAIVSEALYHEILDKVALLKTKFTTAYSHRLWKYDFVHRWTPPDAVSAGEFASEAALFADTFKRPLSLDDHPARNYYQSEGEESILPRDFADFDRPNPIGGGHYSKGPTKKKFRPKKKNKKTRQKRK